MKLYIIRHGQTDWNVEGKIQGRQDIPLNDMGRRQARALADGMKSRPVASVYSSPQKRAMETAEAIAGPLGLTVKAVPQLMEIGYGDWEGRSAEDLSLIHIYAGWLTGATALAKTEDCCGPDLIYLPEITFDIDKFLKKCKDLIVKKPSSVIAVSEGIKVPDGRYVLSLIHISSIIILIQNI